jgi:hypothetical protein
MKRVLFNFISTLSSQLLVNNINFFSFYSYFFLNFKTLWLFFYDFLFIITNNPAVAKANPTLAIAVLFFSVD